MRLKSMALVVTLVGAGLAAVGLSQPAQNQDKDRGRGSTFDIPFGLLPGGRVNASGNLDPASSPEDEVAGVDAGGVGAATAPVRPRSAATT